MEVGRTQSKQFPQLSKDSLSHARTKQAGKAISGLMIVACYHSPLLTQLMLLLKPYVTISD